ncbi:hypothetical protein JJJ17_02705 [Paracoccus caeni]|uniref:Uncharacterized protein n=1 Tax=Paracoccus caeni TaxID=657651 RepID=A0A934VYJ7_9RHOB|nr:hypothetical protein [Paracoccus caeni]MBK4214830.1 hypothetical protein [Paracoccus caeni]
MVDTVAIVITLGIFALIALLVYTIRSSKHRGQPRRRGDDGYVVSGDGVAASDHSSSSDSGDCGGGGGGD